MSMVETKVRIDKRDGEWIGIGDNPEGKVVKVRNVWNASESVEIEVDDTVVQVNGRDFAIAIENALRTR